MSRWRLGVALLVPAAVLVAGYLRTAGGDAPDPAVVRARLEAQAAGTARAVDALVKEARGAALRARDGGPDAAADGLPRSLAARLEGAGVARSGRYATWSGAPAELSLFGIADGGSVRIVSVGMRTSLLVRSPVDSQGRSGAVSFALAITPAGVAADALLPPGGNGLSTRWDVGPQSRQVTAPEFDAGPPAVLATPLVLPDGQRLASLVVSGSDPASRRARGRATTRAWAAILFAMGIGAALARRHGAIDRSRVAAIAAGVIAARLALAWGRSFEEILPRSLGSPSLYGRGEAFGLLASPMALAASACAFFLLARTLCAFAARDGGRARGARGWALGAGAVSGIAAVAATAASLARDARVRVPQLDLGAPVTLVLAASAALVLAGAAEMAGTLWARRRGPGRGPAPGRLPVAAALIPLAALFVAVLHTTTDRVSDERLRTEFAPLVTEQSARRRIALEGAVADAAASPAAAEALSQAAGRERGSVAFGLWMRSDLFHQGFASSIDLYDAAGIRRDHFGFAFPQVGGPRETIARSGAAGEISVEEETVPAGAALLRVVHAEAPVAGASGAAVGRAVGHVLEDPENLPFLPSSAPYLEALGRGSSRFDDPWGEAPDYVLYDEDGRVVISTLRQPPAATASLRAASGRRVEIAAGHISYRALPLREGARLHLLLSPAPTLLHDLGDGVRVLLAGLLVVALAAIGTRLATRGGASALVDFVRGSFYRKLLASVLLASVVPLVGLAVFLRTYIERRGEESLAESAASVVGVAQRVVADYQAVDEDDPQAPPLRVNDEALSWLRRVVGQEIHVFEEGVLAATSKPELFDSGLQRPRLPGEVQHAIVEAGRPYVLRHERLGAIPLPVAYARADLRGGPADSVIAVPLVLEQRDFARSVDRLVEMILLATAALAALLAACAALLARSVADPVRRLADASRRIAGGDYGTRLASRARDEVGSLVSDFNGMAQALSDQRADLERRRDYIETLLRHATTGVVSTAADGRVVTINPAAAALLGGPAAAPRRDEPLVASLRRDAANRELADALAAGPAAGGEPLEVGVGSAETGVRLRVISVPLPGPGGEASGTLVLLDDVTSLTRSNQLAAWAEMARAIAHEIKNPLTPIQLSAEHMRRLLADRNVLPSPEIEGCLDAIVRQVRELRDIAGAFSTYARIPELTLEPVAAGAFLEEVASPYAAAPPEGVRFEVRGTPAPPILADRRLLARAVVNLIENALQAMPSGGDVTLTSGPDGAGAFLAVSDTGPGLTPEARTRLFEPYFSTKSSGTGLGLAIARRVVEAHGGSIEVDAAPGAGTTFRIRVPAASR